jgi:three-Cys-motif partner protein
LAPGTLEDKGVEYSEIGLWSEAKLDIIAKYAKAYSTILSKKQILTHLYVDAFAGPGLHRAKLSGRPVAGSPLNALEVQPPFAEYHFIDLDNKRVRALEEIAADHPDVQLYHGDANRILVENLFPNLHYESYQRALCLLDPYGLDLNWEVIKTAGELGTVEIFLNFPIHDINRNVLIRDPGKMDSRQVERMDRFWGDNSWREVAYSTTANLLGYEEKVCTNDDLAEAFRQRLIEVAGFEHVPQPVYMRNSKRAGLYYLFFASQKPVAAHIVNDIFSSYRAGTGGRLF